MSEKRSTSDDVLDALGDISTLFKRVYDLVKRVKGNKAACEFLGDRVRMIERKLVDIEKAHPRHFDKMKDALQQLEVALKSAADLLKEHNETCGFVLGLRSSYYEEKFSEVHVRLDRSQGDLQLGLEEVRADDVARLMLVGLEVQGQVEGLAKEFSAAQQVNERKLDQLVQMYMTQQELMRQLIEGSPRAAAEKKAVKPPWLLDYDDLEFQMKKKGGRKQLGEGGFGVVYAATWNNIQVAVKEFKRDVIQSVMNLFKKEVTLSCRLQHPYIVHCHGATMVDPLDADDESEYSVVFERGLVSLRAASNLDDEYFKGPGDRLLVLKRIAEALVYLHNACSPIAHRDIKMENVMMRKDGTPMLIDFGLAEAKMTTLKGLSKMPGGSGSGGSGAVQQAPSGYTLMYAAPEVLVSSRLTGETAQDVYSFGCLMYELLSPAGTLAWDPHCDVFSAVTKNSNELHKHFTFEPATSVPSWLQELTYACTQFEPTKRPTMATAYSIIDDRCRSPVSTDSMAPAGAGASQTVTRLELPFVDDEPQLIGEAVVFNRCLGNMIDFQCRAAIVSPKSRKKLGVLCVKIDPLDENGNEGPWGDEDNEDLDPYVESFAELKGKNIQFAIKISKVVWDVDITKDGGKCKYADTWVRYKLNPDDPAEDWSATTHCPDPTIEPKLDHSKKFKKMVDDNFEKLLTTRNCFTFQVWGKLAM